MDARERFQHVNDLFQLARQRPPGERGPLLESACDDETIRSEVLELLAEDERTQGAVDGPALGEELRLTKVGLAPHRVGHSVPENIGHYRIVRKIGEGGMGVVYEAEQDSPRRRVALKIMRPGVLSGTSLKRFEQESHVLGRLHHPGIAQVYDAGSFDTGAGAQPYFAMEFLEGEPLNRYVRRNELSLAQRLELIRRVCDAVQHAHQRGVIHRDLKPGNIIVEESGQPRILDFGVARATNSEDQITTLQTDVGQLIGTLGYMSPEQVSGDPDAIDTRSDIYAIGVLMFEVLADRMPVDISDRTIPEAVRIIQEQEPSRLGTISRVYRGDVDTIVSKALDKDRDRRYQSAEALSDDIGRYLRDEPIVARPASTWYQLRKFARRNRALVTATAFTMGILVVATTVSTVFAFQSAQQRNLEREARHQWQNRFDDVRHLANTFMFDVDELLATVPGATAARELLVSTALEYLDSLAAEVAPDDALQRELADAYLKVGDIQGNPRLPNLGVSEDALESYRKAQVIADELIQNDTQDIANQLLGSRVYERLATMSQYLREPDRSIAEGARAIALAETAVARDATSISAARALAAAAGVSGDTYRQMGQLDSAQQAYQRAYEISRELDALHPDGSMRRQLSLACNDLGRVLRQLDQEDEALTLFQEAMTIREQLLADDEFNMRAQRDLAISFHNVAGILANRGQSAEALDHYTDARAVSSAIAEADPLNVRAIQDVATADEKIGDVLLDVGRVDEAIEAYERVVESRRRLVAMDEANAYIRIGLAIGIERIGDTLVGTDRLADAEPHFLEAYEIASEVVAGDPRNALNQTAAFMISSKLGSLSREHAAASHADRRQRLEAAMRWYEIGVAHREDAASNNVRLLADPGFDPAAALAECRDELAGLGEDD